MIYRSPEEMPEEARKELAEGVALLGKKLREWRDYGALASITGRWQTADRTVVEITCDDENRVWVLDPPGSDPVEITSLVDA